VFLALLLLIFLELYMWKIVERDKWCHHYLKFMCPSLQNNLKYYIHMNIFTYPEKFETEDQKMLKIWFKHILSQIIHDYDQHI